MTYVFCGAHAHIGDVELFRFGQRVELDSKVAAEAIAGGCSLLPAADFDAIGFTPEELKPINPPPGFEAKKHRALLACHALREGKSQPAAPPAEPPAEGHRHPPVEARPPHGEPTRR
jgi:hypothetical protein